MTEIAAVREVESGYQSADGGVKLNSMTNGTLAGVELGPDPIYEKWILSGSPVARSKTLAWSRDGDSHTVLWDCTAGIFYWHYRQDEAVLFLAGDAYMLEENGVEHRFAAGDFAFFPAGSVIKWRVDDYIRKIAFLREPIWRPVTAVMRLWNKVVRKLGKTPKVCWTHIRSQR